MLLLHMCWVRPDQARKRRWSAVILCDGDCYDIQCYEHVPGLVYVHNLCKHIGCLKTLTNIASSDDAFLDVEHALSEISGKDFMNW